MGDLNNLRDNLRDAQDSQRNSNKWLTIFVIAFPIFGFCMGAGVKSLMDIRNNRTEAREFAQNISADTPQLSENDQFLKIGKLNANDPFVLANDQVRFYYNVVGKLETCARQMKLEKYTRLADSYRKKDRKTHQVNQAILLGRTTSQLQNLKKFGEKLEKGNDIQKVGTILAAKHTGQFNKHAAIMSSSYGAMQGYSGKPVSKPDCLKISSEVATGRNKIKAVKI